jgi:hypothetical protein
VEKRGAVLQQNHLRVSTRKTVALDGGHVAAIDGFISDIED